MIEGVPIEKMHVRQTHCLPTYLLTQRRAASMESAVDNRSISSMSAVKITAEVKDTVQ